MSIPYSDEFYQDHNKFKDIIEQLADTVVSDAMMYARADAIEAWEEYIDGLE